MVPITGSVTPSNSLEMKMMAPASPASMPRIEVMKNSENNAMALYSIPVANDPDAQKTSATRVTRPAGAAMPLSVMART